MRKGERVRRSERRIYLVLKRMRMSERMRVRMSERRMRLTMGKEFLLNSMDTLFLRKTQKRVLQTIPPL